ncbi:MAG: hypothetical protein GY832_07655, partial [Chloroflexi bacterium]|nr:hypothetical protein [Chloroflexota bacterium]
PLELTGLALQSLSQPQGGVGIAEEDGAGIADAAKDIAGVADVAKDVDGIADVREDVARVTDVVEEIARVTDAVDNVPRIAVALGDVTTGTKDVLPGPITNALPQDNGMEPRATHHPERDRCKSDCWSADARLPQKRGRKK